MNAEEILNSDHIPTVEELKELFKANDYTCDHSKFKPASASKVANMVHGKAQLFFRIEWANQMKNFGGKRSFKNYTDKYPLKILERADEKLIINTAAELVDAGLADKIIGNALDLMEPQIIDAAIEYATFVGKEPDDLIDEDIELVLQKFADKFLSKMINLMMQTQSVEEIIGITKKIPAHEDFADVVMNCNKIDFDRAWEHTRSRIGKMLSLDENNETGEPKYLAAGNLNTEQQAIHNMMFKRFVDSLDGVEREIVFLRLQDKNQKQIAEALGYKTQGAVSKRLVGIKTKFDNFYVK